jgi:phosphatidate cytidylyltransferase
MGPVIFIFVASVFLLDELMGGKPLPAFLEGLGRLFGIQKIPAGLAMFPVIVAIDLFAAREMSTILIGKGIHGSKRVMTFAAILGLLVTALVPDNIPGAAGAAIISMSAAAVLAFSMVFYARNRSVQGIVAAAGGALLAFVYLGLMFGAMLAIRREHSAFILLWALVVTKSCDIGAYFTGRAIGRHKLIPWLSPGKTWEGLWGGLAFSTLIAYLGLLLLEKTIHISLPPWWACLVPGVLFGAVGQAGDLMESVFKRDAAIKDSGAVVPGMGGVLDVLDSVLLVSPLAYWWLRIMADKGWMVPQAPLLTP